MADFEFLTDAGRKMLTSGYCQPGESIPQMYERVTAAIGQRLGRPDIGKKAYEYAAKGYLCFSTPILCNMGTDRGYPISCFGVHIDDNYHSLVHADVELAMLSRYGGGVSLDTQWIRPRGAPVRNLGKSRGVIPWCVKYDATTRAANQGEVRSAASAVWLNIEHPDAEDFMRIRRIEGRRAFTDPKMICHVINHGMLVSRDFTARVRAGDPEARRLWKELMMTRSETGEPYIMFTDNANDQAPKVYKDKGLRVNQSNICTEIMLASTTDWTFVCCLLSLNVSMYDEWPKDLVETGMYCLDAVQTEFIERSANNADFVKARRFAMESRAVGIGVLGFHSYLQGKGWPINGLSAFSFNKVLFKRIDAESLEASKKLAVEYGEPALMKGYGERFSHRVALAPTRSNAIIHGHVSESIQPDVANHYSDNSHKGNFSRRNQYLVKYLEEIGKNTDETWGSIIGQKGSVQHLEWMSPELKEVFKTAREIDQVVLIKLARDRQPYIDQAQSLNLFFASGLDTKYFVDLHLLAEEAGLKTLYYAKGASNLNVDLSHKETKRMLPTLESMESCTFCEG